MKKWFKYLSITFLGVFMLTQLGMTAGAVAQWDEPTVVYGSGLSEANRQETANLLSVNTQDVRTEVVNGADLEKYLGYPGNDASMISSVLVKRTGKGGGVNVNIATPDRITLITREQYMNAAFTAGIENAEITVASTSQVTGESALTGVYKAFEANGETLDSDRMQVAQEELETTSSIAQTLDEEEGSKLDAAIVDIKEQLADLKERTDELATREEIEEIVNEALAKYDLSQVVTRDQIDRLLDLFEKYQQTSAIDMKDIKNQLSNLTDNLSDKLGDLWQEAEDSGLMDKIVNFFKELWQSLVNLFN